MIVMVDVRLVTADNSRQLVQLIRVPPFVRPPSVIVWGERFFERKTEKSDAFEIYTECFAFYAPRGCEVDA